MSSEGSNQNSLLVVKKPGTLLHCPRNFVVDWDALRHSVLRPGGSLRCILLTRKVLMPLEVAYTRSIGLRLYIQINLKFRLAS